LPGLFVDWYDVGIGFVHVPDAWKEVLELLRAVPYTLYLRSDVLMGRLPQQRWKSVCDCSAWDLNTKQNDVSVFKQNGAMYVWTNIVARSHNFCTSTAVLSPWSHFIPRGRLYGHLMSPAATTHA
jgi:hypothetical protein